METTTVEDRRQVELKALKNSQICMTQGGYPYGTWQTVEVVNNRDQGVSEKDGNKEYENSKFCQRNPKAGDINLERQLMEMTSAETRLSVMSSPSNAIVTVLS